MNWSVYRRAFTLLELLIVVAIISLLFVVGYANYSEAQKQARDEIRMTHVQQIKQGVWLFRERYGRWPLCPHGIQVELLGSRGSYDEMVLPGGNPRPSPNCPDGQLFIEFLSQVVFDEMIHDPLGPENRDYFYYYDSDHLCDNDPTDTSPMIYATNMEVPENSNANAVCGSQQGNDGGYSSTYGVIDPITGGNYGTLQQSYPWITRTDQRN